MPYWRYSGSESIVLQKIVEQKKTLLNGVTTEDILYFDNFEVFLYYFNISEIQMSHTIDVLL